MREKKFKTSEFIRTIRRERYAHINVLTILGELQSFDLQSSKKIQLFQAVEEKVSEKNITRSEHAFKKIKIGFCYC